MTHKPSRRVVASAAEAAGEPIVAVIPAEKLGRVHQGDCIAGMNALPAGSVHLVFADPPFNIGYGYDVYDDRKGCEEYLDWSRQWMAAVQRVLTPTGAFWLAIGDEYAAELKVIAHRDLGFHLRSWVVWYYTFGVNCKKKFTRSHVHMFHFVKDPVRFTFHDEAIRVPSARQLVYADKRANAKGRLPDDTWILRPQEIPGGIPDDHDVWYASRVCGTFKERAGWHGCQMPEQVLGRIVSACSSPGEVVLDPFGGSGTTLAVAKKLQRSFLGFELSPEYAASITARLEGISPGDPLTGSPAPKVSGTKPRRRAQKS
jgi:site-specific DNA-methyltransferase (adenine-specific)